VIIADFYCSDNIIVAISTGLLVSLALKSALSTQMLRRITSGFEHVFFWFLWGEDVQ